MTTETTLCGRCKTPRPADDALAAQTHDCLAGLAARLDAIESFPGMYAWIRDRARNVPVGSKPSPVAPVEPVRRLAEGWAFVDPCGRAWLCDFCPEGLPRQVGASGHQRLKPNSTPVEYEACCEFCAPAAGVFAQPAKVEAAVCKPGCGRGEEFAGCWTFHRAPGKPLEYYCTEECMYARTPLHPASPPTPAVAPVPCKLNGDVCDVPHDCHWRKPAVAPVWDGSRRWRPEPDEPAAPPAVAGDGPDLCCDPPAPSPANPHGIQAGLTDTRAAATGYAPSVEFDQPAPEPQFDGAPAPSPAAVVEPTRSCRFHEDCDDADQRIAPRWGALRHEPLPAQPPSAPTGEACRCGHVEGDHFERDDVTAYPMDCRLCDCKMYAAPTGEAQGAVGLCDEPGCVLMPRHLGGHQRSRMPAWKEVERVSHESALREINRIGDAVASPDVDFALGLLRRYVREMTIATHAIALAAGWDKERKLFVTEAESFRADLAKARQEAEDAMAEVARAKLDAQIVRNEARDAYDRGRADASVKAPAPPATGANRELACGFVPCPANQTTFQKLDIPHGDTCNRLTELLDEVTAAAEARGDKKARDELLMLVEQALGRVLPEAETKDKTIFTRIQWAAKQAAILDSEAVRSWRGVRSDYQDATIRALELRADGIAAALLRALAAEPASKGGA